jgi:hypothetical protein
MRDYNAVIENGLNQPLAGQKQSDGDENMNWLQKFVEQGPYGEKPGRTAYAFSPDHLPAPSKDLEWQPVTSFRPADELLADTGLKEVFQAALTNGCAVVSRVTSGGEERK